MCRCWLSGGSYKWAFAGPVALLLLVSQSQVDLFGKFFQVVISWTWASSSLPSTSLGTSRRTTPRTPAKKSSKIESFQLFLRTKFNWILTEIRPVCACRWPVCWASRGWLVTSCTSNLTCSLTSSPSATVCRASSSYCSVVCSTTAFGPQSRTSGAASGGTTNWDEK